MNVQPLLLAAIVAGSCMIIGNASSQTLFGNDLFTNPSPKGLPAESGYNYSLTPYAGYTNLGTASGGNGVGGLTGSFAAPLGHDFGILMDATSAAFNGGGLFGGGALAFARDPGIGLIGPSIQVMHSTTSGGYSFGFGAINWEGYWGRVTPFGSVGAAVIENAGTFLAGGGGIALYPTDNVALVASVSSVAGQTIYSGGIEYLLDEPIGTSAASLFVNGFGGSNYSGGVLAGVSLKFGRGSERKTLIRRHREDDPVSAPYSGSGGLNNLGFALLESIEHDEWLAQYQAESQRFWQQYFQQQSNSSP